MSTTTPATLPTLPPGWTWSDPDPRYPSVRAPNGVDICCSSVQQAMEIVSTSGHLRADPEPAPTAPPWATIDLSLTIPGPGEIPGLLSYAAPLVTLTSSQWRSTCPDCGRIEEGRKPEHRPVLCVGADKFSTYVADGADDPKGSPWSHSHLALRLDLEPGRACAAWWLAQTVPALKGRGTGATFEYYGRVAMTLKKGRVSTTDQTVPTSSASWRLILHGTGRDTKAHGYEILFAKHDNGWPPRYLLPKAVLSGLDSDDPRTLADGSRWVDAEALRRLVLDAAGRGVR